MTKRQRIDAMREARLWVGQIIVPGVTLAATLATIPEIREGIAWKVQQAKCSAEEKIRNAKAKKVKFVVEDEEA